MKEYFAELFNKQLAKVGSLLQLEEKPLLVIDPEIWPYLKTMLNHELIKSYRLLHENFSDELERLDKSKVRIVVFIMKPKLEIVKRAMLWIQMFQATTRHVDAHFIYVPRRTCECDEYMSVSS